MTLVSGPVHGNNSTAGFIKVYGTTGLSSGAHSIVVTATGGTPNAMAGGSASYTGAGSFGTPATAFGFSSTSSVTVASTTTGNLVYACVGTGSGGEVATSPATLRYLKDQASSLIGNCAAEDTASTGSAVTIGFTQTGDFWAIIAVEILAGAPPVSIPPVIPTSGGTTRPWIRVFRSIEPGDIPSSGAQLPRMQGRAFLVPIPDDVEHTTHAWEVVEQPLPAETPSKLVEFREVVEQAAHLLKAAGPWTLETTGRVFAVLELPRKVRPRFCGKVRRLGGARLVCRRRPGHQGKHSDRGLDWR